jgi:hypothetical protein
MYAQAYALAQVAGDVQLARQTGDPLLHAQQAKTSMDSFRVSHAKTIILNLQMQALYI